MDAGLWQISSMQNTSLGGSKIIYHGLEATLHSDDKVKIERLVSQQGVPRLVWNVKRKPPSQLTPKLVPVHFSSRKSTSKGKGPSFTAQN